MQSKVEPTLLKVSVYGACFIGGVSGLNYRYNPEEWDESASSEKITRGFHLEGTENLMTTDTSFDPKNHCDALILVADSADRPSFRKISGMIAKVRKEAPLCPMVLVIKEENICDRFNTISEQEVEAFRTHHNIENSFYLTAKTDDAVEDVQFNAILSCAAIQAVSARQMQLKPLAELHAKHAKDLSLKPNFFLRTMMHPTFLKALGGLLLLASIAAIVAGTCGIAGFALAGTAALACTIGGGVGAGLGTTMLGFGFFRGYKNAKMEKYLAECPHPPAPEVK